MSRVIDHTALTELTGGGQYLRAVTAHYGRQRRIIAVPVPCVAVAVASAGGKADTVRWYLGHAATVKLVGFDIEDAIATGQQHPGPAADAPGEWLLTAAVVHTARSLHLPVLTNDPGRYTAHDVQVTRLP